jgi:Holliday junction DNA helicase RuvB
VFRDFIGNESAINQIKQMLVYSNKNKTKALPSIGLFGPKSTGKTEICRRIAFCMNVPVIHISKSILSSEKDFYEKISEEITIHDKTCLTENVIVFIDEAHLLSKRMQDSLLTALERDDRMYHSKYGSINTKNITWIIATTDPGKLGQAFLSRLLEINLSGYSSEEVVKIMKNKACKDLDIDRCCFLFTEEMLNFIALSGKCVPRKCYELFRQSAIHFSVTGFQLSLTNLQRYMRQSFGVVSDGYDLMDMKYLKFLSENPKQKLGLDLISTYMDMDKDTIKNNIEPWLIRNGTIIRTRSGRQITDIGMNIVALQKW